MFFFEKNFFFLKKTIPREIENSELRVNERRYDLFFSIKKTFSNVSAVEHFIISGHDTDYF